MLNFTFRKLNLLKLFTLVVFFFVTVTVSAQVCGTPGVDGPVTLTTSVNTYFPINGDLTLAVGSNSIALDAVPANDAYGNNFGTNQISSGDLLLIIQMQDATISYNNNNNTYGSSSATSGPDGLGGTGFTDLGKTGLYEYVVATSNVTLAGGTLTFVGAGTSAGVVNSYYNAAATATRGKRTFQIVRVPQFSNLTLNNDITTPPFNGKVGGIIAFNVSGTFNFNGKKIDGSSRGFRGGYSPVATSGANNATTYVGLASNTAISGKGEGIAGTPRYMWDGFNQVDNVFEGLPGGSSGRGAASNAGGGGNDHNAGGGGGGNGGFGGNGGSGWQGSGGDINPKNGGGRPGHKSFLTTNPELIRLTMGGGGGAGDANNAKNGVKGGVGGAIILINAGTIQGTGNIFANGGDGAPGSYANAPDGAGGAGAGGSVFLNISNNSTSTINIQANGGKGGNTLNDNNNWHGPGGGGGGGIIRFNTPGAVTVNTSVSGGASGKGNNGAGDSHYAVAGTSGYVSAFNKSDLPSNLQVNSNCLASLSTDVKSLNNQVCNYNQQSVSYEVKIKNLGNGNAAQVSLDFLFPIGISFDSAIASYSGNASGPTGALSNTNTTNYPIVGGFNIPFNGVVTVTIIGKITGTITPGTYNVNAQTRYLDPTRTSSNANRKITPKTDSFGTVNTSYETGGSLDVAGTNFNGSASAADDLIINAFPMANAGVDFTKTCSSNSNGKAIGSTSVSGFTYSWSPSTGLSSASVSNPTANPSVPTTYVLTVTNNATGCYATDDVVVTVDNQAPTFTSTTPGARCGSGTVVLQATPSSGTVKWYANTTTGTVLHTGTTFTTPSISSTTTYYAEIVGTNGCISTPRTAVEATILSVAPIVTSPTCNTMPAILATNEKKLTQPTTVINNGETYYADVNVSVVNLTIKPGGKLYLLQGVKVNISGTYTQDGGLVDVCPGGGFSVTGSATVGVSGQQNNTLLKLRTGAFFTVTGALLQGDPSYGGLYPCVGSIIEMDDKSLVEVCATFTQQSSTYSFVKRVNGGNKAYFINKAQASGNTYSLVETPGLNWIAMNSISNLGIGTANLCGPDAVSTTCDDTSDPAGNIWPPALSNSTLSCENQANEIIKWLNPLKANDDALSSCLGVTTSVNVVSNDTGLFDPKNVDLDTTLSGIQSTKTITGQGTFTADSSGTVTFVPTNNTITSATLIYSITDFYGVVSSANIIYTAKNIVPAITGSGSVCIGSTVQLGNTTSGGIWSSSDTTKATVSSTGLVTGVSSATPSAIIRYVVTASGCTTTVEKTIVVNAAPSAPTFSTTNASCSASGTTKINNYASGTGSYIFSPTGPTIADGTINNANPDTQYSVVYNNGSCSSLSATFKNVSKFATPSKPTIVTEASPCPSSSSVLKISNYDSTYTYTFSPSGPSVTSGGLISDATNNVDYTVMAGNSTCSSGNSNSFKGVFYTDSKPTTITTTHTICSGTTYTWPANGAVYTSNQNITITNNSCTADQVLNLTVTAKPVDIVTTATICSGGTYTWSANSTDYTTAQSGLRISNDGCTADQVLNLTVTAKPVDIVTTATICSGGTYTWSANSTDYTTAQSGLRISNDGCTADQVLNLTVTAKPVDIVTTATICSGGTYTWSANSTDYTTAQSGLRISNDGCTADQVLNLTVTAKPVDIVTTATICSGGTYTWSANSTDYTTAQSGLRISNDGCAADQVLNLTVTAKPVDIVTTATICSGGTYTWSANSTDYTTAQSGLRISNDGCTADQVLNLTVTAKPVDIVTTATICSGGTYTWSANSTDYTTAQSGLRISNDGCTADQVLNLTVTAKPLDIVTTATICSGGTYTWSANSTDYTTAQSGLRISNDGCTADQVLNLTVTAKPLDIVTTATICSGGTYTWSANSTDYTTAQSGLRISNDGCTADQVLNLTVTAKPVDIVTTATICSGGTYTWSANSTDYTTAQSGLRISNDGCTADQVLNLTVTAKPVDIVTTATICSGGTYTWSANSTDYTTAQSGLRISNDGCTADQVLNLTVTAKPVDIVTTATICSGGTYTWSANSTDYTTAQSGLRISNDGCTADQVLNLTVTAKPVDIVTTATICSGGTYTWSANSTDYTTAQSGLRISNDGCTADQVLNLTVTAKPVDIVTTATICSGGTYTWSANSTDYTTAQSGLRISNDGCTADQVLNLTVTAKPLDIVTTATICSGGTYTWSANSTDYTTAQSGLRISNDGCTADQVLNLTVTAKPVDIVTTATICSGGTYTWSANSTDYTTAQSGLRISNDGCTADQVLNLTVTAKPVDIVTTATICSGGTYTWSANSTDYTTAQSGLRISNDGCTADQVLNLTVTAKPLDIVTTATICSGGTYTWSANSTDYTTAQSGLRISNDGCTADQVLNLTVTAKPVDIVTTATICSGGTYTWSANSTDYTTAQSGLRISNDGCTADQVLNLTVTAKPLDIVTTATICSGGTYTWSANSTDYTTAQSGLRISNDGCTADQVLNLTVTAKPLDIVTTATICSGGTYTWSVNSTDYTTAQSGLRISNDGCTADQVLNLTVTAKPVDIVTTATICSGGTYTWSVNSTDYTTAQSGLRISNDGCTADQVLNLTVTAKPVDIVTTATICSGGTYTWSANSTDYTTAQSGLRISNDGCTADQVLNLTVTAKPVDIVTTATICSGGTYTWSANSTDYTTAQSGLRISNDGCTADQVLNLTVTAKPVDIVTTATICSGGTYTWSANSTDYTTAQSGLRISNDGCTADQVLNLTVTAKPVDIVTTATICSGGTYTWSANSTDYTTAQSGLRISNDGCTADQVLNLTVTAKPVDIVTTATICSGGTYTWSANSTDYTTAQSGLRISNDGCTADQVLNLTVTAKPVDIVTTATICSGGTYTWSANSTDYTTAQSGLRISNDGCTADQVLNLTVTAKPVDIVTTATICSGGTYTWSANSTDYTTAQSGLRISNDGCTADQVLNLTVTAKPLDIVTTATICSGGTYTWSANSTDYTTAQSGLRISNDGCTADQVLNLTVTAKPLDIVTTATICSGGTYTWSANSTDYTTAQSGLRISNDGCTADQVLNLTVTAKPLDIVTTATICSGGTYTWSANSTDYTTAQSGLRISNDGCTADQVLNLTVTAKPVDIVTTATICSGGTYTWSANSTDYTTAQSGLRISNDGCTADQVLNLTVTAKPVDIVTTATICSGGTYTWSANSTDYTTAQSGLRISNDGCTADQVLNLTVTAKPVDIVTTATICSGGTYTWSANSTDYTTAQSGLRISNDGCTADQVLNLTVTAKPVDIVTTATICSGGTYTWSANSTDYTTAQSGLRISNDGCTADQVLNLTVTAKPLDIVTTATICSGGTYTWSANSTDYTTAQSGLRISNDGCTADQVLNLTVTAKPVDIVTTATICSGGTYTWSANSTDYTTAQSGLRISNDGCTADQVLNLTVTAKPVDIVTTATICSGGTYTWSANSTDYTTAQSGLRISNDGCTADQVLNLTVTAKPLDIVTTATICSGGTYTWSANSTDYTTAQSGLRISNDGCTADQVLNLTVTAKPLDIVTTATICSGGTYTWSANSTDYTTAQSGLRISNDGCTADQVLNLTVTAKPVDIVTTATICSGGTYTWSVNSTDYTTAQSGLRISNDGCTADQVLNLTVTAKPVDIVTTATICSGGTYTWSVNSTDYTTAQSGLRISNDGCTADQVLNLTVTAKPVDIVTTATICSGGTYTWSVNSTDYTTAQSGLRISNDGCTADQVLNLTVNFTPLPLVLPQVFNAKDNKEVKDLVAIGTNLKWYASSSGATLFDGSEILVSGLYFVSQSSSGCESEKVSVMVNVLGDIQANPDNAGPIDIIKETRLALNVFDNDKLDGVALDPLKVSLNEKIGNPNLTLNADGTIDVKPNTPSGQYQLTYEICELLNSSNCSEAVVTVDVVCDKTKISGILYDESKSNAPLANVPVTLIPQKETTGPILFQLTRTDGTYNFEGIIPGDYLVQVQDANLNSAYALYPSNSSLFFTKLEKCAYQVHDFAYEKSDLPVLGDFVWYDANSDGKQNDWFDANNDGLITKNIPDENGYIDYSKWEWIDYNGDNSFEGPQNAGEVNAGFGNTNSSNIFITGPNGYSKEVIIGVQGFWRTRPGDLNPWGEYTIELRMDDNLEAASQAMSATGLVRSFTGTGDKRVTSPINKSQSFMVCGLTNNSVQKVNLSPESRVHLEIDFGISCKRYGSIEAVADSGTVSDGAKGESAIINVLRNDKIDGNSVDASQVDLKGINLPTGITLNSNGTIDVASGTPKGDYIFEYQICEKLNPSNCSTVGVSLTVLYATIPAAPPAVIFAKNDGVVKADGINGSVAVANVLQNDALDGAPLNPAAISLNGISLPKGFVLNSDGTLDVEPNTAGGNYTFSYEICEIANSANCATATVNVFVESPAIALVKTAVFNDENGSGYANAGETITFSFAVTNTGNTALENVIIIDPLPGLKMNGGPITLAKGQTDDTSFKATYTVTQNDINAGFVSNQATTTAQSNSGIVVEDLSDNTNIVNDNPTVLSVKGCVIKVFNAMSPNGDSENERFYIQGIECYPDNTVEIYNRWGVMVFESNNYNNVDHVFKGFSEGRVTIKESGGLPAGTYFYVLKYKDSSTKAHQQAGYLYITK